jgi:thiol-disulfide isomerase/thioredoxin
MNNLNQYIHDYEILIVVFTGRYCQPCHNLLNLLTNLQKINNSFVIKYYTFEEYPELRDQYKIMSVPTILIFYKGKQIEFEGQHGTIDRIVGFHANIEQILNQIIDELKLQPFF